MTKTRKKKIQVCLAFTDICKINKMVWSIIGKKPTKLRQTSL